MTEVVIKLIGNYSYQTAHCLGEGVYGKVYEGMERDTKEKVAIKKVDLNTFTNDKYLENAIFSEIFLLKRFNHPNIVKFKDVLSSKNSLYIITEFCKHGDLKELFKRKRFREDEAFEVIRQMLCGFSQLVQEKIVHRDLKPANILIHENTYKIADFGFAKYVDNFNSQMLKSCVGSPIYMAPQILDRSPYTTKCDIWSIGVIFYEMLFATPPWKARDENELLKVIKNFPITTLLRKQNNISLRAADFLKKCLAYSQDDRASWPELFDAYLGKDTKPEKQLEDLNQLNGRNRYISSTINTPNNANRIPATIPKKQQPKFYPSTQTIEKDRDRRTTMTRDSGPSNNSNSNPSVTPNSGNSISGSVTISTIQQIRKLRDECVYKHFICAELFMNFSNVRDFFLEYFKFQRFLMILVTSVRTKSSLMMHSMIPYRNNKAHDELYRKMEKEHASYEELEKDITEQLEKEQTLKRVKEELSHILVNRSDISDARISKIDQLLLQSAYENASIFSNEVRKRSKFIKDFLIVQVLDWMVDILSIAINKDRQPLDISYVTRTEEIELADYLARVISKLEKILTSNN